MFPSDTAPMALFDKIPSLGLNSQRLGGEKPDFSGGFHDTEEMWSWPGPKEVMALAFQTGGGWGWGSLPGLASPVGTPHAFTPTRPLPSPLLKNSIPSAGVQRRIGGAGDEKMDSPETALPPGTACTEPQQIKQCSDGLGVDTQTTGQVSNLRNWSEWMDCLFSI